MLSRDVITHFDMLRVRGGEGKGQRGLGDGKSEGVCGRWSHVKGERDLERGLGQMDH